MGWPMGLAADAMVGRWGRRRFGLDKRFRLGFGWLMASVGWVESPRAPAIWAEENDD